jgi:hypothetical protein
LRGSCALLARAALGGGVTFLRAGSTQRMMMKPDEALQWLRQVQGQLYRNNRHDSGKQAWVAVVRSPRAGARKGKLIIALGDSMEEATTAAEGQWQRLWGGHSRTH